MTHFTGMVLMLMLGFFVLLARILFKQGLWKIESTTLNDSLLWGVGYFLAFSIELMLRMEY